MPPIFFELIPDFQGTNFNWKHSLRPPVNIRAVSDKQRGLYALQDAKTSRLILRRAAP